MLNRLRRIIARTPSAILYRLRRIVARTPSTILNRLRRIVARTPSTILYRLRRIVARTPSAILYRLRRIIARSALRIVEECSPKNHCSKSIKNCKTPLKFIPSLSQIANSNESSPGSSLHLLPSPCSNRQRVRICPDHFPPYPLRLGPRRDRRADNQQ